jgi:hypothetical protein
MNEQHDLKECLSYLWARQQEAEQNHKAIIKEIKDIENKEKASKK